MFCSICISRKRISKSERNTTFEKSQALNQFLDMTQFSDTESPEWRSDHLMTKNQMILMLIFLAFSPEERTAFSKGDHALG